MSAEELEPVEIAKMPATQEDSAKERDKNQPAGTPNDKLSAVYDIPVQLAAVLGRTSMPGLFMSTSRQVMPACL